MTPIRNASAPSIYRPDLFKGKVALVTGGGTGIGKCIAHELASLGCDVVIAARNEKRLEEAAEEIRSQVTGQRSRDLTRAIRTVVCDIRKEDQVSAMVDKTLEYFGRLDFLINNAGGQFRAPVEKISPKGFEAVSKPNMMGTYMVTKKAYDAYMKEHGGRIVNIILVIDKGYPMMAHSAAARAGIENLSKSLSIEWAASNIQINNVAPGIIVSNGILQYPGGEAMSHKMAKQVTAAQRVGTVEEVAASVLYYLSPATAYTTGETIHVDGGWNLYKPAFEVPQHEPPAVYGTSKL